MVSRGGTRNITDNGPFLSHQCIQQGRLANIGLAHDRNFGMDSSNSFAESSSISAAICIQQFSTAAAASWTR